MALTKYQRLGGAELLSRLEVRQPARKPQERRSKQSSRAPRRGNRVFPQQEHAAHCLYRIKMGERLARRRRNDARSGAIEHPSRFELAHLP